ncbi:helix-turn-helix transcriptional regulator [uncultured Acetatifactor sp.]|uniref:helix-turn-helix domain-containing protein n=1 Tax=uncultured Acetatifactor sp. TaxID=1671927 RepID=UPI00263930E7|nr:helix-turn-helix transcriptional regulator [uncultured Acetatifactor sp.]
MHRLIMLKYIPDKTMGIDMKLTGRRLKSLCDRREITVKTIQKELYIGSFQSVYAWFAGKTLPSLDNMYRLSRLLRVPMDEMIVDMAGECWVPLELESTEAASANGRIFVYANRLYM